MVGIVRKTISLRPDVARETEAVARAEGKTFSVAIEEALRLACARRREGVLQSIQGYWSRLARQRGMLTERDLERYLNQ